MAETKTLHRKWRPNSFDQLIGQKHIKHAMETFVKSPQNCGMLFSGPRGTGKTTTARLLAKALNCVTPVEERSNEYEPCETCASCTEITNQSSMDVVELDAASNSSVDDIRDLIRGAALATSGQWKVYIIDEAHGLSRAANNALLKTLEEPPEHTMFVLATTEPEKVLDTVKSRCKHYRFTLLEREEIAEHLSIVAEKENLNLDESAITSAARKGRGSVRDALSALEEIAASGKRTDSHIETITTFLLEKNQAEALKETMKATTDGYNAKNVALDLLGLMRELFLIHMGQDNDQQLVELAKKAKVKHVIRAIETLSESLEKMAHSPDTRVNLELAIIKICEGATIDEKLAYLNQKISELNN